MTHDYIQRLFPLSDLSRVAPCSHHVASGVGFLPCQRSQAWLHCAAHFASALEARNPRADNNGDSSHVHGMFTGRFRAVRVHGDEFQRILLRRHGGRRRQDCWTVDVWKRPFLLRARQARVNRTMKRISTRTPVGRGVFKARLLDDRQSATVRRLFIAQSRHGVPWPRAAIAWLAARHVSEQRGMAAAAPDVTSAPPAASPVALPTKRVRTPNSS